MSTYMPKAGDISRTWYILDAEGQSLGRVAAKAAHILRGKHKPTYAPHADCGDHVIIINTDKAVLTGKKLDQKSYKWHTGWIGGLKEIKYSDMMANQSDRAMTIAVEGMLLTTHLAELLQRDSEYTRAQSTTTLLRSLLNTNCKEGAI